MDWTPEEPTETPEIVAELTTIALEEYALHIRRTDLPARCRICDRQWPCGIRRWAEHYLLGPGVPAPHLPAK